MTPILAAEGKLKHNVARFLKSAVFALVTPAVFAAGSSG
jgi:hypothetical protein